mmetsp:Transcript_24360/g.57727  ORF Transcript_24360/g.57727 Transcript_24360/m.57727 type:complete len:86 (-) Transcript_24360:949-1206(-)
MRRWVLNKWFPKNVECEDDDQTQWNYPSQKFHGTLSHTSPKEIEEDGGGIIQRHLFEVQRQTEEEPAPETTRKRRRLIPDIVPLS